MAREDMSSRWKNPYTAADWRKLRDLQRQVTDIMPVMDKMEACGLECEVFRDVARDLLDRLSRIEKEFMTPAPQD